MPELAEFEWMWSGGPPKYRVCKDEALKLVGGDEQAAEEVISGRAPLQELPPELLGKDKAGERATWAKAEGLKRPGLNLEDLL